MNMKRAIYLGKENVKITEAPIPEAGDKGAVIRNLYSSICGTDVAVYNHGPETGHKITVGGEFSHETVSVVTAVGKDVKDIKVGDRVYPYPLYAKGDTKRAGTIGGFSEYIYIPEAKLGYSLYRVPEEIPDRTACLIEPFTVGTRAARRSMPKAGEKAVVFGCGTIGIAAAAALKYFGVEKVMICDIADFRLGIAKKLGFEVCNTSSESFIQRAKEYFGTARCLTGETADADIFIDAAGAESILETFMQHGKFESRFVSVAVNKALRSLDLLHLTYGQQSIIGSGGYMPEDVRDVFEIMKSRQDIGTVITHEYPIDRLSEALKKASDSSCALNVVINFSVK